MKNLQMAADILVRHNVLIFFGRVRDRMLQLDRENGGYSLIEIRKGIMTAQNCVTGIWERISGVFMNRRVGDDCFIPLLAHTVRPHSPNGSDRAVELVYEAARVTSCFFAV